jgi:hypothetical protein
MFKGGVKRMTRFNRIFIILAILLFLFLGCLNCFAQIDVPFKAELPAVMTNPGQAPEGALVNLFARKAGIELTENNFLRAEDLEGYKTLILIIGESRKGLGAAGLDIQVEVNRGESLIETAKEMGVKIVGIYLGGAARLGGNSMMLIDLIVPESDYLIITEDGNVDDLFTNMCKENEIPLTIIENNTDIVGVLESLFQIEEK